MARASAGWRAARENRGVLARDATTMTRVAHGSFEAEWADFVRYAPLCGHHD